MAVKLIHSKRLEKVVQNCVTGNPEAQRELYDLYSNKMLAVCCRYLKCRMDAEDALHEGFIRLFKKIHLYSGQGSFEGWMRSLFVNVSLRLLEKKNKLRIQDEEVEPYQHPSTNTTISDLHHDELIRLVNELPDGYRVIFVMYAIEGFSHKEIARYLNISESTSKSQLSRARNTLRSKVEQFYGETTLSQENER